MSAKWNKVWNCVTENKICDVAANEYSRQHFQFKFVKYFFMFLLKIINTFLWKTVPQGMKINAWLTSFNKVQEAFAFRLQRVLHFKLIRFEMIVIPTAYIIEVGMYCVGSTYWVGSMYCVRKNRHLKKKLSSAIQITGLIRVGLANAIFRMIDQINPKITFLV